MKWLGAGLSHPGYYSFCHRERMRAKSRRSDSEDGAIQFNLALLFTGLPRFTAFARNDKETTRPPRPAATPP